MQKEWIHIFFSDVVWIVKKVENPWNEKYNSPIVIRCQSETESSLLECYSDFS